MTPTEPDTVEWVVGEEPVTVDKVVPLAGKRQRYESSRAVQGCNDYLRLGPGRTLRILLESYLTVSETNPPTLAHGTVASWCKRYGWVARAEAYDVGRERLANERAAEIMHSGLALAHARVEKLQKLAQFLEDQMYKGEEEGILSNIWLEDVKQIGSGATAEKIPIERFNAAIISEFRAALNDLAKETGGRVRKQEVTGADGGPIRVKQVPIDFSRLTEDEFNALGGILAALAGRVEAGGSEETSDPLRQKALPALLSGEDA